MREIRFRAWDKIRKSMQTSRMNAVFFDGRLMLKGRDEWQSKDFILMQFTGLKLKGREIYEGDILGGHPHATVWVEWNEEYGCFEAVQLADHEDDEGNITRVKDGGLLANDLHDCGDKWEVIGNIYQNPELLKDGAA